MSSTQTKLFKSNKSQAVRLPKAVELPEFISVVDIVAIGNTRIITPAGDSWDVWFDGQGVYAGYEYCDLHYRAPLLIDYAFCVT